MKNLVLLSAFACLVACNSTQPTEEVTTTVDSVEVADTMQTVSDTVEVVDTSFVTTVTDVSTPTK